MVPPLVSHRTRVVAPARAAASTTRNENSGLALKPSKKCSASYIVLRPERVRNSIESATMATPSSSVVSSASNTW